MRTEMGTSYDERPLKELIAAWLAVTQGVEVPTGLDAEEALKRAAALRRLILDGKISPAELDLDEDLKDVLSALVRLIWNSTAAPEVIVREADAVYQFIRRIRWPRGVFDEQRDLLLECAAIGRRARSRTSIRTAEDLRPEARPQTIQEWLESEAPYEGILSSKQALAEAKSYLATPVEERSEELKEKTLTVPEILLALSLLFREQWNISPAIVAEEASSIYRWLAAPGRRIGLAATKPYVPDEERDYFLGEMALVAAEGYRHLGKFDQAERYLDRADAGFRHTVNPAPNLANVAYARLALRYDQRRLEDVLELLPSLVRSYESLGMKRELVKCRFLEAMTLKLCGRTQEAFTIFKALQTDAGTKPEDGLFAQIHVELGEQHASEGRYEQAMAFYQKALILLRKVNQPITLANLKAVVGETFRVRGKLSSALEAFREALDDYQTLGMSTYVAYVRIAVADTLLAMERPREAEAEILAALPTIEEQKMVPEGFAAVALLRESVRRRKTDPEALRQLREQLQPKS